MYLYILVAIIFFACFAATWSAGLWSNTITLVNVLIAGLVATNFFEPLAAFLDSKVATSATYLWDFIAVWLLFGVTMTALRGATDYLSTVKVKFPTPVERAGGILMAAWVSWVVLCFAMMTLHVSPLARNFLGGAFQPDPDSKMVLSFAPPDLVWLGWMRRESLGPLSHFGETIPFDPNADFVLRYGTRREEYEDQLGLLKGK